MLKDAELAWIRALATRLETGELDGVRRIGEGDVVWAFTDQLTPASGPDGGAAGASQD